MMLKNAHLDPHARVLRDALRDDRARQLDAVQLHVAAPAQLDPEDQLQWSQRGHLLEESRDRDLDQGLGVFGGRHAVSLSLEDRPACPTAAIALVPESRSCCAAAARDR